MVSRQWFRLASDDRLWELIYLAEFGYPASNVVAVLDPNPESQLTRPGAEPRFDYHRRISPSLTGGHLTGPF